MTNFVKDLIKRHEGFSSKPYHCTEGKITIGYGRNLESVGISKEEAELMLDNDISWALEDCKSLFPSFEKVNDIRKAVLINMMFNLGKGRLSQFYNMRKAVERHDYEKASEEMLDSKWAKQVGHRANELSQLMLLG